MERPYSLYPFVLSFQVDEEVFHLLKVTDALDYLPNFAYHRVTASQLSYLTDEDLKRVCGLLFHCSFLRSHSCICHLTDRRIPRARLACDFFVLLI